MCNTMSIDVLTADVKSLQSLLETRHATSRTLVELYLAQIRKHDGYLHAMIQIAPYDSLMKRADEMDQERSSGVIRGPLHGVPIIIKASTQSSIPVCARIYTYAYSTKDNIATHPNLSLGTTAGSLSLLGSKPRKSALLVDRV